MLLLTLTTGAQAQCVGDCDSSEAVTVDEVLIGVNLALGVGSVGQCPSFDSSGDGAVTVDEVLTAVRLALEGCPAVPTATPTRPATPTVTPTAAPTPIFPAAYRQTYTEVRNCRPSVEHGGVSIRVLANPVAVQPYLDNENPLPVGSIIIKEEFSGPDCADNELVRWRVMRKEAPGFDPDDGDWSWQWVNADRSVFLNDKATCIGCHARPACVARDRMCTERGAINDDFVAPLGNLTAALLSISGRSETDVYAVGADPDDGFGPLVLHYDGSKWKRLKTGASADLWWITVTPVDGRFYLSGDKGLVLELDPDTGVFSRIETPGQPTLYGIWGSAANDLWTVGGNPEDPAQGGVIWHYDGSSWTEIDTDAIRSGGVPMLFKVWGRGPGEVYAVGNFGVALRYDGGSWKEIPSGTVRPLFTVHGNDNTVVASGGFIDGVMIELEGDQFVRRDGGDLAQMNGVFVPADGAAVAVGISSSASVLGPTGWSPFATGLDETLDFHAVWVDPRGGVWAVGGDLSVSLSAGRLGYSGRSTISSVVEDIDRCPPGELRPSSTVSFKGQILPLLQRAGCSLSSCHGGPFPPSNYDLRTYEGIFGEGVQARSLQTCDVTPGNPDASYLMEKILGSPRIGGRMPSSPLPMLSEDEIDLIRTWILEGAGDDRAPTPTSSAVKVTPTPTRSQSPEVPTPAADCAVDGNICTVAGTGNAQFDGDGRAATLTSLYYPMDLDFDATGAPLIVDWNNLRLRRMRPDGRIETIMGTDVEDLPTDGALAKDTPLHHASDIAFDQTGMMYVAGDHAPVVFCVDNNSRVHTRAGNGDVGYSGDGGPARQATLATPFGVLPDENGGFYVADLAVHVVRHVDSAGVIETIAGTGERGYSGDGGPATEAKIAGPVRLTRDADGNLYIVESYNSVIRRIDANGIISTFAGTGQSGYSGDGGPATAAKLNEPYDAQFAPDGSLFIADSTNNVIRRVTPDGRIHTVAGTGADGFSGDRGPALAAKLSCPSAVQVDGDGALWIADTCNHRVRRIPGILP